MDYDYNSIKSIVHSIYQYPSNILNLEFVKKIEDIKKLNTNDNINNLINNDEDYDKDTLDINDFKQLFNSLNNILKLKIDSDNIFKNNYNTLIIQINKSQDSSSSSSSQPQQSSITDKNGKQIAEELLQQGIAGSVVEKLNDTNYEKTTNMFKGGAPNPQYEQNLFNKGIELYKLIENIKTLDSENFKTYVEKNKTTITNILKPYFPLLTEELKNKINEAFQLLTTKIGGHSHKRFLAIKI